MKIIKPELHIPVYDGIKIMKNIEKACRTCYRSEDKITDDSYKKLISNCITRGHESVLEHEKITIRMVCDVGCYKDLTRHRIASFSIESTRYCNYNKDKFGNEIKFIEPIFYENRHPDEYDDIKDVRNALKTEYWVTCMENIEASYMRMNQIQGITPDELRMLLPHSTAAEVTMTANIREWKHILTLRASKHTHPSIQQLMIPLLLDFKKQMPEIFNSVEYNEDFPKEKYAELSYIEEGDNIE